jgi:predicted NAD/FAD-binding protein
LQEFRYDHPTLDEVANVAQRALMHLQGERSTWFAGAWLGYGFHEDGLRSAHAVAAGIANAQRGIAPIAADERAAA